MTINDLIVLMIVLMDEEDETNQECVGFETRQEDRNCLLDGVMFSKQAS